MPPAITPKTDYFKCIDSFIKGKHVQHVSSGLRQADEIRSSEILVLVLKKREKKVSYMCIAWPLIYHSVQTGCLNKCTWRFHQFH